MCRMHGGGAPLALAMFVAFFLVHCYPAPTYVQQTKAMPQPDIKMPMANFGALNGLTSPEDVEEGKQLQMPCISAKQRRKLLKKEDDGISRRKTMQMPKATTTTKSTLGVTEDDIAQEGVLLRPISWDLSSTRPTTP